MKKVRNTLLRLTESEIERAEIVLATRNEIVDKLQRDAEKISNMKVDILSPLVDRVKAEHGLDAANKFRSAIEDELERALTTLLDVKDKISTHVLRLTGDISSAPDIQDMPILSYHPSDASHDRILAHIQSYLDAFSHYLINTRIKSPERHSND